MRPVRLHPLVYDDIDEAFAQTRERFGPGQVSVYERLIVEGRLTLGRHPTIGQLHPELGVGVRVFCIAQEGVNAPHGYIYKVGDDEIIYIARLVHLARYLPDVVPEDF
jgi:plasmid stabilization system protein ParE